MLFLLVVLQLLPLELKSELLLTLLQLFLHLLIMPDVLVQVVVPRVKVDELLLAPHSLDSLRVSPRCLLSLRNSLLALTNVRLLDFTVNFRELLSEVLLFCLLQLLHLLFDLLWASLERRENTLFKDRLTSLKSCHECRAHCTSHYVPLLHEILLSLRKLIRFHLVPLKPMI